MPTAREILARNGVPAPSGTVTLPNAQLVPTSDPRVLPLAHWLYGVAIEQRYCDKCDYDLIPPLYMTLARALLHGEYKYTRIDASNL